MIFLTLFWTFFKIGMFTIGGGYAMIPLIRQEVLEAGWMTSEALTDFIAVAESTPGPFAVNTATFVGYHQGEVFGGHFYGPIGAFCATLGVILPSFIAIVLVAYIFKTIASHPQTKAILTGVRPVVLGLVFSCLILIGKPIFFLTIDKNPLPKSLSEPVSEGLYLSAMCFIFCLIFGLSHKYKIHPIFLVIISSGLGILFFGIIPKYGPLLWKVG